MRFGSCMYYEPYLDLSETLVSPFVCVRKRRREKIRSVWKFLSRRAPPVILIADDRLMNFKSVVHNLLAIN